MKKQRGYLIDMKKALRIRRLRSRLFRLSRIILIFMIVFSWVFAGYPQFWGFPPSPQFAFAQQYGRPNADDGSVGTWTGSYTDINDTTSNDTTFIETSSHAPTVGDYFQVSISNLDDPNTDDDHIVRYRYGRSASGGRDFGIEVGLYQGTTLIASWTHSTVPATPITQAQTLSTTEAGNITDYEDLSVRFTIDSVGAGQPRTPRWYWAEVEVPDVVAGSPPTLLTHSPTNVDQTSVTGQGEITDDGGGSITSRGFVWSTISRNDPGNTSPSDSDYEDNVSQGGSYATGTYSLTISGLDPGETYYYRAFALNSEGYAYGDEEIFSTDPEVPTVVTNSVSNVGQTSATGHGEITNTGGEDATERGFVWGVTSRADPGDIAPGDTNYDDFVNQTGTYGTGAFSLTLSNLVQDTTYYYRAYARNSAGYSYGNEIEFSTLGDFPVVNTLSPNSVGTSSVSGRGNITDIGAGNATERGFVYGTTTQANPGNTAPGGTGYDTNVSQSGSFGTGQFTLSITGLDPNTTYFYRAYAQNSEGYAYGSEIEFKTDNEFPVVTTASPFDILTRQVTGSGSVTNDKGLNVTERGFVWGVTSRADPGDIAPGDTNYDDFVNQTGTYGVGSFNLDITGLDPNTTYYYRAYARNSEGYAYGNQVSFKTATAQFSRPSADESAGTWQPTPLYENINSTSRNDSSYIYSANNTSPDIAEIHLSNVDDPGVNTGHILRYTYRKDGTGGHTIDFRMRLLDGTTEIASWLHSDISNTFTLASQTLTTTEAGNITDYEDLRIEVSREGGTGGGPTTHRSAQVSWVEFELPEAPEIDPPSVTTGQATNIGVTEATGQGNVTNTGGLTITERGFVWSTQSQTSPGNTAPGASSYSDFVSATGTFGSGSFSSVIGELDPETTYFYRAYAYNSEGYSYGSEVAFQTYAEQPTVSTNAATSITGSQADGQGQIVFVGSSTPFERGFVWSTISQTNPNNTAPEDSDYSNFVSATGTFGTENFSLTMTSLNSDTIYFYRAYARNDEGYGYGEEREFQTSGEFVSITTGNPTGIAETQAEGQGTIVNVGLGGVNERGFVWSTISQENPGNTEPGESAYGSVASSTGTFEVGNFSLALSGLEEGTVYYYRAYANNSAGYSYGNEVSFNTLSDRPTLLTKDPSSITHDSVTGQGEIIAIGLGEATSRGFVYGTTTQANPGNTAPGGTGYDTNVSQSGSFGVSEFPLTLSNLDDDTTYYYRAYAQNSEGYGYGNEIEFKTLQEPFPPELSNIELNNTGDIFLVEGSTTTVPVSATVTDPNGWGDIEEGLLQGVVYRSGVGSSSVANLNNSYPVDNLSLENCEGNSCDITGSVSMWYFTEPTDDGTYSLEHWEFWVYVEDSYGYSDEGVSQEHSENGPIDVMTLLAIWVGVDEIDYGEFEMGEDTGVDNVQTIIRNTGNSAVAIEVSGENMQLEPGSEIEVSRQQWATAAFIYGGGTELTGMGVSTGIELSKPTSTDPVENSMFWGLGLPEASLRVGRYKGNNSFIAVPVE